MFSDKLIKRRDFIRLAALSAGATLVAACAPKATPAPAPAAEPAKPAEQPAAQPAAPTATPQPAPAKKEPVKLTWLVRSSPTENPWEEDIVVPTMKALHPDISIEVVVTPGNEWKAKVMSMYAGGTPPDVHNGIVGTFIQLYSEGMVLQLDDFIARDSFDLEPFGPLRLDPDCCRSGKQMALPILTTAGCPLFYNMDLLDEAGLEYPTSDWTDKSWTWDVVLEYALKLTKDYGTPEAVFGFNAINQFHCWAYVWGKDCWEEEWYARGIHPDPFVLSEEFAASLQFRQDLIHKHKVMPTPSDQAALNAMGNPFMTSKVAMMWDGGWGYWNYAPITEFRWGAAACPWGATNRVVNWTDSVLAAKASVDPDAAWALISYLTGVDGQTTYAKATNTPPTRDDAMAPWLDHLSEISGMERGAAEQVALGYRASYTDNWAHFVINSGEYQTVQNQEGDRIWANEAAPAELLPAIKAAMKEIGAKSYDAYKNSPLATDELCAPLF